MIRFFIIVKRGEFACRLIRTADTFAVAAQFSFDAFQL